VFELIRQAHKNEILKFVQTLETGDVLSVGKDLLNIIERIYADIPEKRRISLGRYSVIKKLGTFIYPLLEEKKINVDKLGSTIFHNEKLDLFLRSLGVQLSSIVAEKTGKYASALDLFGKAAMDKEWIVRECSAGFVRKLIKKNPAAMHEWYLKMIKSDNAMQRRFAVESLRPVADNQWFKKNPEFAFSIIEKLFTESEEYPRTSVGNSLSDWMRIDEKKTWEIVKKLAASGNKNSYWIAYRACRNLVKKKPMLVMDMLNIDCYKYKDRIFYREN
jgi:3-methyladenine DNA glycosylase AlkC